MKTHELNTKLVTTRVEVFFVLVRVISWIVVVLWTGGTIHARHTN